MNLDFPFLDDLALAAERDCSDIEYHLFSATVDRIGPLVELAILERTGYAKRLRVSALPNSAVSDALVLTMSSPCFLESGIHHANNSDQFGFIRTARNPDDPNQDGWIHFCQKSQEAAERFGIPKRAAQQLIGALREMEDNVHLHSQRSKDGIVGYSAKPNCFEFMVADSGIGVLKSLRQCPEHSELGDAGTAIKIALTDGKTRFGSESGHGYGFHGLFVGLASMNGHLRFRSGDHALAIDGSNISLLNYRLTQCPYMQGFSVNVQFSVTQGIPHLV